MPQFDDFKWLMSCEPVQKCLSPNTKSFKKNINNSTIINTTEGKIVLSFYKKYIKFFGINFIQEKIEKLDDEVTKEWALFCIEEAPIIIKIANDTFDKALNKYSLKLGFQYSQLQQIFNNYKPFITEYSYYQYAYDNIDSHNISYFFILLMIMFEDKYPIDKSDLYQKNFYSCPETNTCRFAKRCSNKKECILRVNMLGENYNHQTELINFQKEITNSFITYARNNIKEKALVTLYNTFDQINKTDIFKEKLITSFEKVLYNEGIPLTGDFFMRWDKISFFDGYYLIEHPLLGRYAKKSNPLRVKDTNSRKIFNTINSLFLKRLPPLQVQSVKGQITRVYNRVNLNNCISLMEYNVTKPADIIRKPKIQSKIEKKELSPSDAHNLCKEFKSRFLDYLCKKQLEDFKVICCIENRVNSNLSITKEYSFIFTIKKTQRLIYLAYENASDSRCTYLFPIPHYCWEKGIEALYSFFASNEVNKRQALSKRIINLKLPGGYDYIRVLHTDYLKWVDRIKYCL